MTLPILLLLTMLALDFGRVYLGWINLQNMTRIAANYAANNPTAWTVPQDTAVINAYQAQIAADAKATNCTIAGGTAPAPVFTDTNGNGSTTDLGDTATVGLTCDFRIITPVISAVIGSGGTLSASASAVFPVKSGLSATTGGTPSAPTANFVGTPTSGVGPLSVQFTDQSSGSPVTWQWDFNNDGTIDSNAQNPTHIYSGVGVYTVSLTVGNSLGSDTRVRTTYISVSNPPPGANFTATPTSGTAPLAVTFTDTSTGSPTAWAWDFDNNGTTNSTLQNPTHTYSTAGVYTVKLTATIGGAPFILTRTNYINVSAPLCQVPDFASTSSSAAQATWNAAGFTTTVQFQQGGLPWTIKSQNIVGNSMVFCNSVITVSKN